MRGGQTSVSGHGTMITTNPDGSMHIGAGTAHTQLPNNLNLRSGLQSSASRRVEEAQSRSSSLREQETFKCRTHNRCYIRDYG